MWVFEFWFDNVEIKSVCFHRFLERFFSVQKKSMNIRDPTYMCHGAHSSLCNACYLIFCWKRNPDLREDWAPRVQAVKISCLPAPKHHLLYGWHTNTVEPWDFRLREYLCVCAFCFFRDIYTFRQVINFMSTRESQLCAHSVHLELALNKCKWARVVFFFGQTEMSLSLMRFNLFRQADITPFGVDRQKTRWVLPQGSAHLASFSWVMLRMRPCKRPTFASA